MLHSEHSLPVTTSKKQIPDKSKSQSEMPDRFDKSKSQSEMSDKSEMPDKINSDLTKVKANVSR